MRVGSAGLYSQVLDAIGRNQSDIARLQLQVATGRRILTPADDPFGATRSLTLHNASPSSHSISRTASGRDSGSASRTMRSVR